MHEPPPSLNVIDIKLQTKIEKGDPEMLVIQKDWDMSTLQATNTAISLTSSQKMILRKGPKQTDKSKVLNIDLPQNYEKKSDIYMARTDAYMEINEHPLKRMIESTNLLLTDLLSKKRISKTVYEKLKPPQDCELPHLYYNPKDHKPGAPLRPIVAQIKSPVARISHFLDKTLRPIFEQHTAHYTLQNTDAFLNHLERPEKLEDRLKFYNEKDPHIKLTYEIGKTANYLDVTIFVLPDGTNDSLSKTSGTTICITV
ncbi:unnamed protein product [Didymodactylos carnosus]|uniref:Reverse transcriptase n=1 Tax=Didymodactylos carnosus TaxID=1234261 RepID=A0A8S2VXU2_9BILA|nr:unnamed protein product [Didymodactylos carnosus]